SQLSATSHGPAAARQTAVLFASAGHVALLPVQNSAGSQTPAEARHDVVDGWNPSVGQLLDTPSQVSATSQTPGEGRRVVPAAAFLATAFTRHAFDAPSVPQVSSTSHEPAFGMQTPAEPKWWQNPSMVSDAVVVAESDVVPILAVMVNVVVWPAT